MKKSIQIQIPEPCHENWDKMNASAQGRFCNACSKVVVDFSMMSDKEILNYISNASSKICGRVSDDQLNRPIQMPVESKRISFRYLWSLLISSLLITYKTHAQGKIKLDSIPATAPASVPVPSFQYALSGRLGGVSYVDVKRIKIRSQIIKGKVTSENGEPVPFATIILVDSKLSAVSDSSGEFQLKIKSSFLNYTLSVSSVGYESVLVNLKEVDPEDVNIVMSNSKVELLGEVKVTAYDVTRCNVRLGGISYGIKYTEKSFPEMLKELIVKNEIKIFPNPVSPGASVNISVTVAETGNYKLELFDASGRLMHASTITISSKKYVMNLGSSLSLIPGMYFVKILSNKGKQVYSGSLLVQ